MYGIWALRSSGNLSTLLCPPPNKICRASHGSTSPTKPTTHIHTIQTVTRKTRTAKIQQEKKGSFCILDFKDFHPVPEVYAWPQHLSWLSTSTDRFQFSTGNCTNGSNAQLIQYSSQPRVPGMCAVRFSDVSRKDNIPVSLWTPF